MPDRNSPQVRLWTPATSAAATSKTTGSNYLRSATVFGMHTKTDLGTSTGSVHHIIGFDYGLGEGDSFSQGKIHVRLRCTELVEVINTF